MITGWLVLANKRMLLTFVYAKCTYTERRALWADLDRSQMNDCPWMVLGDFHAIRMDSERIGGHPRPLISMSEFNECLDMCGLLDLPSSGQTMSWCNGHEGVARSWAKLDRVVINNVFSSQYSMAHLTYLNRKTSDHCPMIVNLERPSLSYGPVPFRFQNMWCLHENFLSCVQDAWHRTDLGSGMLKLAIRLKRTKVALRAWNRNVFGLVDSNLKALEGRLENLENLLQMGYAEDVEEDYLVTKLEINVWEKREAIRLGQIAKQKWLIEGDQNTKFFHSVVNQRRRKSQISRMVLDDGTILNNAEEVHLGAAQYFRKFLTTSVDVEQGNLASILDHVITEDDNNMLCLEPSEMEVKEAMASIPRQSSPGPDGFGFDFYMHCWDFIKEDVVEAARDFFRGSPLPMFYSSSFIVLIPKEMVHSLHRKTVGGNVMVKIDMAKAYDRVHWGFLLEVLRTFGFSNQFCNLISQCVKSPFFSVMMNGTFKDFFQSARGLRQGDPLSPYLFIIMEEVLTRLLRKNFEVGRIGKFTHPMGAPLISHLLYADDLLIFANGQKKSMKGLVDTLATYERWSGLFGVSSLAWTGHLVHVAIPASRGEYVRWNNFLDVLPHPQGLGPLFTGQWNLYAQNHDSSSHLFGTSQGSGTAILTLLGGFHPQTQSLWLTDIAHHHLAIAFIFLVAGHMYRTNFGIGHSINAILILYIGMHEESNALAILHGGMNQDNFESELSIFGHPLL
ncbi:hypothetical protein Q3G72_004017 [Acer saccharum]|nr:hypothetical protein Q3G72_004017 [Acer saccharum]